MSDEEKKAIERFKANANYCITSKETTQTILNLIEKQQKEIEELNLQNIELKQEKIIDRNKISNQDNFYDYYNYISKDKIKAKINELEYDQLYEPNKIVEDRFKIEILKELLEEE